MSAATSKARETTPQLKRVRTNGMTPLMRAACDDSVDAVQALLDGGADVNAKRDDGFTALALAAFFGRTRIVELLLERGADVRAVTRFSTSPELWAKARGFREIVSLLQQVPLPAVTPNEARALEAEEAKHSVAGRPLNASRILPEIYDPPPLIAPAFHPGHTFLTRISSDRRSLAAVAVVLIVVLGLAAFSIYQARSLRRDDVKQTATRDIPPAPEPQAVVPQQDQQSVPQESGNAREIDNNQTGTVDLNNSSSSPTKETTPPAALVKPSIKTFTTARLSHSSLSTVRRDNAARREQSEQAAEPEIESKPAPLTVEVSRDRNTTSQPATRSADPPPPQSAPLGITSRKTRSKVIQWP